MRHFINLIEQILTTVNVTYSGHDVDIHHNPDTTELMTLFKQHPDGLRAVCGDGGLFVWDAQLLHDDAMEQIGGHFEEHPSYLFLLPNMAQVKGTDSYREKRAELRPYEKPLSVAYGGRIPFHRDNGKYM